MAGVAIAKAVPNNAKVKYGTPTNGMIRPIVTDPINPTVMTTSDAL